MEAVLNCMVDEKIGPDGLNAELGRAAREIMGARGGCALRSPALALSYIFDALELTKGDGVILSALAPGYQFSAAERCGYKALVADVSEDTGLMRTECAAQLVREGGRAVILHETMGILPDIEPFLALGVPVVEDISHSAFAKYPAEEGAPAAVAGSRGPFAVFGLEERDIVTGGGGALLISFGKKEWTVMKNRLQSAASTDMLPDMNSALALAGMRAFQKNEQSRRELFTLYSRAIASGRNRTFSRAEGGGSTVYSFPLILSSGAKEALSYAKRHNVEARFAYEESVIALHPEAASECACAASLLLRCVLFPLYPRLGQKDIEQVVKVLSSLP